MDLSNISINKQSSIRIAGSSILYFDAFDIPNETHDADFIFVTHEHFDHFDIASIAKIIKADTVIVAPESMKKKLLSELSGDESGYVFAQPEEKIERDGLSIETVRAYNILKPFHMKSKDWLGYIVTMDDIRYYVAGDTDANEDNKKVKCDVALIPIGGNFTMDKKHAAKFVAEIKPRAVIPTHYGEVVGKKTDGADFMKLVEDKEIQVELKL